ncbi:MAG: hypothetical protein K5682_10850, partial [Lachnospiraceae bacterium]|nr:hypothetical protein [Lachnospiraceae bacterium]
MQFIGSILELLGVSMLLPFVEALLSPEKLKEHQYINWFSSFLGVESDTQLIIALLALLIIIYIVKNCYMVLMLYVQYQIVWHNRLRMEAKVMDCFLHKSYIYHTQVQSGEIQRTLDSDIGRVFDVVNNVFLLTSDVLTCIFLVIYLVRTDVTMTMAVVAFLALFIILFIKVFKKRLYIYGETQQKYAGLVNTYVIETMRNIKEIKVYQKEPFFIRHYYQSRAIQSSMMKRGSFLQLTPKYLLEAMCVAGILSLVLFRVAGGT